MEPGATAPGVRIDPGHPRRGLDKLKRRADDDPMQQPWTIGQGVAIGLLTVSVFWAIVREMIALHL